ncbi:MAG: hypothetical protein JNJ58_12190 [Chitinophagaceae bacterium]|nr:hypothetical protein [Chitinophagaceae bacterium]
MNSYKVNIVLDQLYCFEEGDGSGNAEPYIWTAFFKIDKDTCVINTYRIEGISSLEAPVLVHFGSGSHSNLNSAQINLDSEGMDADTAIPIPAEVGSWMTTIKPMQIADPFNHDNILEIPGVAGVFYMLLEEDSVASHGAEAGHLAFNSFFASKINYFFRSLDIIKIFSDLKTEIDQSDREDKTITQQDLISAVYAKVGPFIHEIRQDGIKAVKDGVMHELSFFELIMAGYDADDYLGDDLQIVNCMDLQQLPNRRFESAYPKFIQDGYVAGGGYELAGDGSFKITGYINATELPVSLPPFTDRNPEEKGAEVFRNVNFEGDRKFFKEGEYRLSPRNAVTNIYANSFDNNIDSIRVDSGYFAELFKSPDFTGEMLTVTHDTPIAWLNDSWRDQISSIRVKSLTNNVR